MHAPRLVTARPLALNGSSLAIRWRTAKVWQAQATAQGKLQRAAYAIPPQDKQHDDLGGPYGQEHPNPAERKKVNRYACQWISGVFVVTHSATDFCSSRTNRGFASQTIMGLGLVLGFGALFTVFSSPRAIAEHQIANDKVIGSYRSNTGAALAEVKRGNGATGAHALHQEQTAGR